MGLMMRNESRALRAGGTGHALLPTPFWSSDGGLEKSLSGFMKLGQEYGFTPTISAHAALMARRPTLFRGAHADGAELAVGGDGAQQAQLHDAVTALGEQGIPVTGVRFLSSTPAEPLPAWLPELGIEYTSTWYLAWEVMDREQLTERVMGRYQDLLTARDARDAGSVLSLPRSETAVLDLPVTMPDDVALGDLLQLPAGSHASVWLRILQRVHRLGEAMILCLDADRLDRCREGLDPLMERVRHYSPHVWVTTMGALAAWWRERQKARLAVTSVGDGQYRVSVAGDERLTLLSRHLQGRSPSEAWCQGYRRVEGHETVVECPTRPSIGIGPGVAPWIPQVLREMGFVAEESDHRDGHGLYFDEQTRFSNPRDLLAAVEGSEAPLVRLGLWPDGAACALSIAGDIRPKGFRSYLRGVFGSGYR